MSEPLRRRLQRLPDTSLLVTTVVFVLMAAILYGYGFTQAFTMDLGESCQAAGQPLDSSARVPGNSGPFPLSEPCNADYDLVPQFINPTIIILLCIAAVSAITYVWGPGSRRHTHDKEDGSDG